MSEISSKYQIENNKSNVVITPKNKLFVDLDDYNYILDNVVKKENCKIQCMFSYEVVNPISSELNNFVSLYFNTGFVRHDERHSLLDKFKKHLQKYDGPNYDLVFNGFTKLKY